MATPSSSETFAKSSLPAELNTATREEHHSLNRLIIARLPLCLPPHATNPLLYTKGMIVIGQIYLSFERAWDQLLSSTRDGSDNYMTNLLRKLRTPRLPRTTRLEADLQELRRRLCKQNSPELKYLQEQSRVFAEAVTKSISIRPHVILAYAWTMYLALFNGGRWIKKQLHDAGQEFWLGSNPPLSFWDFEGDKDVDGESVKLDFKQRFAEVAAMLTPQERKDVIVESKMLFGMCTEMVGILDQVATSPPPSMTSGPIPIPRLSPALTSTSRDHAWLLAPYFIILSLGATVWRFLTRYSKLPRRLALAPMTRKDVHTE